MSECLGTNNLTFYLVSHGNGTQKIFYDNPNVLYISVHRWEHGKFYPFSGAPDECGQSEGLGFNINIALNECKDKPSMCGFIAVYIFLLLTATYRGNG